MNILPVINLNYNSKDIKLQSNRFGLRMAQPLSKDTVSFGARHFNNVAVNTGKDLIEAQVGKNIERYIRQEANKYFAVSNMIAENQVPYGISFNKKYALFGLLKSPKGTANKMSRLGSLYVPDRIRTTFFLKKFYDPSVIFEKIIPEYKENGYIVSDIEMCLDIDKDKFPDFIKKVPEEYQQFIKGKRKSGVEQYQIRFIREWDKSENPLKHELLIIPGYNYAVAKYYESTYIYDFLRNLGELNFIKKGSDIDENVINANVCINVIKNILNLEVSQKLFANAKNSDLYNSSLSMTIDIQEREKTMLDRSFKRLRSSLLEYYEAAEKRAKTRARLNELNKLKKEDLNLLSDIKLNIIGGKERKTNAEIQGAVDFFNNGKYKADPFK